MILQLSDLPRATRFQSSNAARKKHFSDPPPSLYRFTPAYMPLSPLSIVMRASKISSTSPTSPQIDLTPPFLLARITFICVLIAVLTPVLFKLLYILVSQSNSLVLRFQVTNRTYPSHHCLSVRLYLNRVYDHGSAHYLSELPLQHLLTYLRLAEIPYLRSFCAQVVFLVENHIFANSASK